MTKLINHYAVIGFPIDHSLSPTIHHLFAQQTQQSLAYEKIAVSAQDFLPAIKKFQATAYSGLNITSPLKKLAYQAVDNCSDEATVAQAVNTLIFAGDKIVGHNTDGIGLVRDLTQRHLIKLNNKRILILGAGGAAWGICHPLLRENPSLLHIANRTLAYAEQLATIYTSNQAVDFSDLSNLPKCSFDLIINTIPRTAVMDELPHYLINQETTCYDINYGASSAFLQWGKNNNAKQCLDGLGMLVEQAAVAFSLWRGVFPDTQSVLQGIRENHRDVIPAKAGIQK